MVYEKTSAQDIRRKNRSEILRKIYFNSDISRLDVSNQLGISPATATNIVTELIEKKILIETGIRRSESGRPSTLLAINADYGKIIGMEVGETFIRSELFDLAFNPVGKYEFGFSNDLVTEQNLVKEIIRCVKAITSDANVQEAEILGVGIGFPGLVDPVKGLSIFTPNWGWHNVSITRQLAGHLNAPIYFDNGAKLMAVGELLFGAGRGLRDFVVLLMGTGVGTGIIANGKLFRGSSNSAGEFGHTTINPTGPRCRCGNHGCMEVYLGAPGILSRYRKLQRGVSPFDGCDQIECVMQLLLSAEMGDPAAGQVVEETIDYLGICIANIINSINPDQVLIGGWSGLLFGQRFLTRIESVVARHALEASLSKTTLRLCHLGNDAVSKGAAGLVLQHFFESNGDVDEMIIGGKAIDV